MRQICLCDYEVIQYENKWYAYKLLFSLQKAVLASWQQDQHGGQ